MAVFLKKPIRQLCGERVTQMKRIIAAIMVLVSVMMLSGCRQVPSFMPSYWDGLTKRGTMEFIQDSLQEKYGEEFTILNTYYRNGDILADCSPKNNADIIFEIQALAFGKERVLRDTYIQSIVRQEMKNDVDSVLSKYYDRFAVEVEVSGLFEEYDSGIRSAEKATVKNYSEALPNSNKTHIWIALNEKEVGAQGKINDAVNEMVANFYLTLAHIHFYYTTDEVINQCIEKINNKSSDRWGAYIILQGHFPYDAFVYDGNDKDNKLAQVGFASKQTLFNGG